MFSFKQVNFCATFTDLSHCTAYCGKVSILFLLIVICLSVVIASPYPVLIYADDDLLASFEVVFIVEG